MCFLVCTNARDSYEVCVTALLPVQSSTPWMGIPLAFPASSPSNTMANGITGVSQTLTILNYPGVPPQWILTRMERGDTV